MAKDITLFLFRRFLLAIVTIFLVASASFFLMRAIPGDPFSDEQSTSEASITAMRSYYGLNDPLHTQYLRYIGQIFRFDFGPSLKYPSQTVNQIISGGFPISAMIGAEALIIAIPLGMLLGSLAALYNRGFSGAGLASLSIFGVSVPSFVLATSFQFLFAIYFPLFPVARFGTFSHSVLPAFSLAVGPACYIARLLRASILDVQNLPYIQTARLKGLSESRIMITHVWKNALIPILAYLGPVTTNILVGSFVVERIFGIPGLGQWFVNGVINRDYPVIGGLTVFYSMLLLCIHSGIDIITSFFNPGAKILLEAKQ